MQCIFAFAILQDFLVVVVVHDHPRKRTFHILIFHMVHSVVHIILRNIYDNKVNGEEHEQRSFMGTTLWSLESSKWCSPAQAWQRLKWQTSQYSGGTRFSHERHRKTSSTERMWYVCTLQVLKHLWTKLSVDCWLFSLIQID